MHTRASRLNDANDVDRAGSEAIAKSSQNQQSERSTRSVELARESAIGHLNNARQILSAVHSLLTVDRETPAFSLDQLAFDVVLAGRRIAKAVEMLTPPVVRSCSNCTTPMIQADAQTVRCIFCGQEEQNGQITIVGEVSLDVSSLALSQADGYEVADGDVDEAAAIATIEASRQRYHASLEPRDDP